MPTKVQKTQEISEPKKKSRVPIVFDIPCGRQKQDSTLSLTQQDLEEINEIKRKQTERKQRHESRVDSTYRRLVCTNLTLEEYKNEIGNIKKEIEVDVCNSTKVTLQKIRNDGNCVPCGIYQQEKCPLTSPHIQSRKNSSMRHHVCDLCQSLLGKNNQHEAANCEILKILDDEFQDWL